MTITLERKLPPTVNQARRSPRPEERFPPGQNLLLASLSADVGENS